MNRQKLKIKIGRRGATLLCLGAINLIFGWFFLDPHIHKVVSVAPVYRGLQDVASLYLWGVAWWTAGVLCVWEAFRQKDVIGFVASIIIKVSWSAGLFASWLIWDAQYAWAQAILWLGLAVWTIICAGWPEPLPPIKLTEGEKREYS